MALNRLDLNRLVALDALLAECSVSRAAERLHVSQPAMSATLAALREHFHDPLLVNAGRAMRLTGFAQSLASPVQQLLTMAQAVTQRRPGPTVAHIERSIAITASDMVASVFLSGLAERAVREAPGLRFELRPVDRHLRDQLDRGEVDIVIAAREGLAHAHPKQDFFSVPFACLVSRDHACDTLDLQAYLERPHVSIRWPMTGIETMEQTALKAMGLNRRIDVEVPAYSVIAPFLLGTRRIATVPRPLADQVARYWPLEVLPCPLAIAPLVGAVQWHRCQDEDLAIRWVVDGLTSLASELRVAVPSRSSDLRYQHDGSTGSAGTISRTDLPRVAS